jgi:hypothetical protein
VCTCWRSTEGHQQGRGSAACLVLSPGTCFPEVYVFPRFTVAHVSPGTRFTLAYFPVAHVFHRHMFSPGICFPIHGTCFPEAHVFPRLPVAHVFPRHTFHHGTYFPTVHVFPLYPLILLKQTPKKETLSHSIDHGTCFPTALSRGTCFPTGTSFPLAYVFPRHMFSRGTCVPAVYRGTCFLPGTRFTTAHIFPRHMFFRYTR